jgi:hypothetical protein
MASWSAAAEGGKRKWIQEDQDDVVSEFEKRFDIT